MARTKKNEPDNVEKLEMAPAVDPISEQAETVINATENLLFEMEVFMEKLRNGSHSITRVNAAKTELMAIKKNLLPYVQ
jgi:oligoribonuclease (3'-5' exoribonuclease)